MQANVDANEFPDISHLWGVVWRYNLSLLLDRSMPEGFHGSMSKLCEEMEV
jgi:hypothetical protein